MAAKKLKQMHATSYSFEVQRQFKKITTTAGFEPARAEPKRFLIFRLNHSAKLPLNLENFGY